uniref:DUF5801 repeats-in-toxin domain-containing protein n=1 Tax=Ramlibacter sp. 2FC TaxID=2502188 RepID=UPI0010F7F983
TLTQSAELDHVGAGNDLQIALAAGKVSLSATATTTDGDGDTATATVSADLGGNIRFDDDVPSVTAGAVADGGIILSTEDPATDGVPTDTDTASASFAAAFLAAAVPVYGADGAGSTVISGYTLSITGGNGTASGLTSNGLAITLAKVGNDVVGSTAAGEVFRISVASNGTMTLSQSAEVDHLGAGNDLQIALAAGLVTLSATATTTDGDGDTATAQVSADLGGNISFADDVPVFSIVNDGADAGTAVSISAPNPATNTTYAGQFADWTYGADGPQSTPTLSGVTGNVSLNSGTSSSLVIDLKDASNNLVGQLTLNADGTDSLQVFHRAPTMVTDTLLTSDVTASGPGLVKTINSSISGLVITITGSDGNATPNQSSDEVNPSAQGWAIKDNQVDVGESITFSFNQSVDRFSFVADGFSGNPNDSALDADALGDVGLTIRVYYDAAKTIYEDFTNITVNSGGTVQIADLSGFGTTVGGVTYTSFYGVNILSDNSQDSNDGFRLNSVTVSKVSSELPPDLDYSFTLNIVDGDGDAVAQSFSVHLDGDSSGSLAVEAIAGTSGANTLVGTGAADVLIGGAGNDTLEGGGGADVFKWSLSDEGTVASPAADVVKDFNLAPVASGGDALDLKDLLTGEHANSASLDAYLDFGQNGSGQTVISVHTGGADSPVTQTITLENVQYTALQTYAGGTSDAAIITKLLTDGNLKTDV